MSLRERLTATVNGYTKTRKTGKILNYYNKSKTCLQIEKKQYNYTLKKAEITVETSDSSILFGTKKTHQPKIQTKKLELSKYIPEFISNYVHVKFVIIVPVLTFLF